MRRLGCLFSFGLAAAGTLAAPDLARAASSARLVYMRGPGADSCPGEQAVRAAVSARLGYDPFFGWAHDTVFVGITRSDGAFRLEIKLVDDNNRQRGSRDIAVQGDECADIIDVMGLTISLVIDPTSVVGSAPSGPAAPIPPPEPPQPEPNPVMRAAPAAPIPDDRPAASAAILSQPLSTYIGFGLLGSLGAAPAATAGGTLFVDLRWRTLSLDLEGRADLPATAGSDLAGVTASSWLVVGSIAPCLRWSVAFGCPIASIGALGATSRGPPVTSDKYAPWLGAGGRAGAEFALSESLTFRVYAELLRTLMQHELQVDGERAYRFGPWSGGFGSALAWRVP
jgi:hypothetical protein